MAKRKPHRSIVDKRVSRGTCPLNTRVRRIYFDGGRRIAVLKCGHEVRIKWDDDTIKPGTRWQCKVCWKEDM